MGILMVGLPICAAIKTVCLNMTGFWLPHQESPSRENCTLGSEGGDGERRSLPLSNGRTYKNG